jgi:SCP-2 sterol transfer family
MSGHSRRSINQFARGTTDLPHDSTERVLATWQLSMAPPVSFSELSTALNEAVDSDAIRRKFNTVLQFYVITEDEREGTSQTIGLDARADPSSSENILSNQPALVIRTSLSVLQDLLDQKYTPQKAFLKGKIKIQWKMALAMKLPLILKATRTVLSQRTSKL